MRAILRLRKPQRSIRDTSSHCQRGCFAQSDFGGLLTFQSVHRI